MCLGEYELHCERRREHRCTGNHVHVTQFVTLSKQVPHTHTHENCGSKMRSVLFFFFGAILFYAKMINTHKCSVSHECRYFLLSHEGLERKRGIYCFNSVSVC